MKPIRPVLPTQPNATSLPGVRAISYAEDQDEYQTLPGIHMDESGRHRVITRWKLSWRERLRVLWTGDLWLHVLTFGQRLQPVLLDTVEPKLEEVATVPPPTPPASRDCGVTIREAGRVS